MNDILPTICCNVHGQKTQQVTTILLTSCNRLDQKADIRSFRMACDSLLTTTRLQVVNRLVASLFTKRSIERLVSSCFNISSLGLIFTDLLQPQN